MFLPSGSRPSADDVERLLSTPSNDPGQRPAGVQITNRRGMGEGWLELLASGLTFDLHGLAPARGCSLPRASHFFGLPDSLVLSSFEAIALYPGPHLANGTAMVPVVRTMSSVACDLAQLLPVQAVCWQPAGCWMDPHYFQRITAAWLAGGAFPALGLTGIERRENGSVESDGLAFFIGQEMRLEPQQNEAPADTIKLGLRLIDHFVRNGPVLGSAQLAGPAGEPLLAEASSDGRSVRVRRQS